VPRPAELRSDLIAAENNIERFWREMREGFHLLRGNRNLIFLGICWALFLGAMMTGVVVTAPLSDNIFHAGAVGYGWLNAGWGTGAFVSALFAPWVISAVGSRRSIAISMALLAVCIILAPLSSALTLGVAAYAIMGSARGISGVAMNTSIMDQVPKHLMGRVQNIFYFAGTSLQVVLGFLVGAVAQASLVAGFAIIGLVYAVAFLSASWPVGGATVISETGAAE
jgi:MFS family permease